MAEDPQLAEQLGGTSLLESVSGVTLMIAGSVVGRIEDVDEDGLLVGTSSRELIYFVRANCATRSGCRREHTTGGRSA
jgi:hypothetical protein